MGRASEAGEQGDGRSDRGAATTFDPMAGVRAVGEVQRRSLSAAGELVDRLVRMVDGDGGTGEQRTNVRGVTANGSATGRVARPSESLDELVELWVELVRLGIDVIARAARPTAQHPGHGSTVDVGSCRTGDTVRVVAAPGDGATGSGPKAEIWLHNGTERNHDHIELHSSDLRAHDGASMSASAVRFEPVVIDLPARSSRGVALTVAVEDVPPATYRGIVLATGLPQVWVPLEVEVAHTQPRVDAT